MSLRQQTCRFFAFGSPVLGVPAIGASDGLRYRTGIPPTGPYTVRAPANDTPVVSGGGPIAGLDSYRWSEY